MKIKRVALFSENVHAIVSNPEWVAEWRHLRHVVPWAAVSWAEQLLSWVWPPSVWGPALRSHSRHSWWEPLSVRTYTSISTPATHKLSTKSMRERGKVETIRCSVWARAWILDQCTSAGKIHIVPCKGRKSMYDYRQNPSGLFGDEQIFHIVVNSL